MCGAPDIEEPTQYQSAKEPEYSDAERDGARKRGRASTILAPTAPAGGAMTAPTGRKTLLGQ